MRGKHVVITGASAGIGEAIARELARAGAKLTLVARRKDLLDRLAAEVGVETHVVAADLADSDHASSWLAGAIEQLGPVDVLVNNAGIQIVCPALATDVDAAERMLRVNVFSPMRLALAVLPSMIERRSGTIVNVASTAAIAPMPGMFYYNAAKGGLAAASEGLRGELRGTGVNVVTVYPGPVESAMERAGREAYQKTWSRDIVPTGRPSALARLVRRAVERGRARVIYPSFYNLARWFPSVTRWATDRFSPPLRSAMPPAAERSEDARTR